VAAGGLLREAAFHDDAAGTRELDASAWLTWVVAVGALAFLTSNPLYVALCFIATLAAYASVADSPKGRAMLPVVILGLILAAMSVPFNLLTGSSGDTVLFELPTISFPSWFGGVTVGGDITGEALIASIGRALGIAALVVSAAAFNSGVNHFRLLRLAPTALAQLMTVFTIAALVVPQGMARARLVAEGRRLRGRSVRGIRSMAGIALPVLQGALEGAVQRAESLDAKGFGGGSNIAPPAWKSLIATGALGLFAWGAFSHYYNGSSEFSVLSMVLAAGIVLAMLYSGRRRRRAGVSRNALTGPDWLVVVSSGASVALIVGLRASGLGDVSYLPYPDLAVPEFHPAGGAAALLLLAPALVLSFLSSDD
jgi:energy-coupling factor transport system permease protein